MQADGPALVAFPPQSQRGLFSLLPKILDQKIATRRQPNPAVEVEFDDRPVAVREHRVAGRQV
jgi:hypothetical protein